MAPDSPLQVKFDHQLGGRWVSLRHANREWLWTNPDDELQGARRTVDPGSGFVDVGGGEECFPSVRAPYDHGLVWNRPWKLIDGIGAVEADGYRLERNAEIHGGELIVTYRAFSTEPLEMVHATHLLLDVSDAAELVPARVQEVRFFDPPPDDEIRALGGINALVRALGRGQRGAVCYGLLGCNNVVVRDGSDELDLTIKTTDSRLPVGFFIWRNLMGWPSQAPYRSIGVEPAVGRNLSLGESAEADRVIIAPGAPIEWSLTLKARHSS